VHESDNVDHTFAAVERLRRVLAEHDRRGERDTPFFIGIRETLNDLDEDRRDEQSAA
jgi:chlorite dismutase